MQLKSQGDTTSNSEHSTQLNLEAAQCLVDGVNSPVRAFHAVDGIPPFIQYAKGAYLFDADNKQYIDYIGGFGPQILGHSNPTVIQTIHNSIDQGLVFGASCENEIRLAQKISQFMPNIQKCRFTNSGTEATMTALRLARAATQRDQFIQFEGGYHGHADYFLVKAGSGALTHNIPSSSGIPKDTTKNTLIANYNDIDSVEQLFKQHPDTIAAIIVEPIAGNMNMVLPTPTFLTQLRSLCDQYGALLIFDEVMTGFRVALGGAQSLHGVKPDLTTLGKIIGGGLPIGAVGGPAEIMDLLAPLGSTYHAGTFAGNPVSMAAGLATLNQLTPELYTQLAQKGQQLINGLKTIAHQANMALSGHVVGGMFGLFFTEQPANGFSAQLEQQSSTHFKQFHACMRQQGVYFAPSLYEAGFISSAHTDNDIQQTLLAFEQYINKYR